MARKFASAPSDPQVSQLARMLRSLEGPLAPEARRVLAAARVGLKLLEARKQKSDVPSLHERRERLRSVAGGTPLQEEQLPGCIQSMLAQYRALEEHAGS
jgi:hypothetical protein